jgi:hypothetical protein
MNDLTRDPFTEWLNNASKEELDLYRGKSIAFSYKEKRVVIAADNFNEVMVFVRANHMEDDVVLDTILKGDEAPFSWLFTWEGMKHGDVG